MVRLNAAATAAIGLALALALGGAAQAGDKALDPGKAQPVEVKGDRPAYMLPASAPGKSVLLYLHGRCGDPFAGARAFPEASSRFGTMVIVTGDEPCPDRPGRRRWSPDPKHMQKRIDAAIEAVGAKLGWALDGGSMTVIGYSEGALRAELLARAFPARYPRVVLVGEPRAPSPLNLSKARAIAAMVGERDAQQDMREGARALEKAGLPVRFSLLPGARHGQYGPEGNRVMGEALAWAFSR